MQTCTRRFEWDAAHRVLGHKGKCRHLHGHRYVAEVTVSAKKLDNLGMVIDFSVLKEIVGKWIDDMWDHNILLNEKDPLLRVREESIDCDLDVFAGRIPYIFQGDNPTAENIAEELFVKAERLLLEHGIWVTNVRVWETPNCYADYNRQTGGQYHA